MLTKYNVMFTAGGRSKGAKIGEAEKAAMHEYILAFAVRFPNATIHENLGMAELELTPEEVAELESDINILYVLPVINYELQSTIQTTAPWHLSNISQSQYESYEYTTTGKGIPVYIVDTGIDVTHFEFESRAVRGLFWGQPTNMHGTHVAGIVGSKTYGVAKKCTLIDVQVFDPLKDAEGAKWLIYGINYILATHTDGTHGVVNMSIGGPNQVADIPYRDAILSLIAEGLIVCCAAGNDTDDAANYFPASIPEVITVGAIDKTNTIADYSNWGSMVDIFAPGTLVLSTSLNYTTDTISGTSMATPCVTGICARYLELCPNTTNEQMRNHLVLNGIADVNLGLIAGTTTKRAYVNMPGYRYTFNCTLSKFLEGQYRQYYYIGATKQMGADHAFGTVKRIEVLQRFGLAGTMDLATEITKVTLPDVTNPVVTPPIVLPPPIAYDGGFIVINLGWTITYRGTTYPATLVSGTRHEYKYLGMVDMIMVVLPDNAYTITVVSQLPQIPDNINYDGGTLIFNTDFTINFKGQHYTATSIVGNTYTFLYPGIMHVIWTGLSITTYTQRTVVVVPPPVIVQGGVVPQTDSIEVQEGVWEDAMVVKMYPPKPTVTKFSPVRVIGIDVQDPNCLSSYTLNLQFPSGTFSYTGMGFVPPVNKTAITVQGHNGIIERVAKNATRGNPPISVEGRLLPVFQSEMIYINKYLQLNGTPYETATIVGEVAALAGAAVTFNATNNQLKEFEFTGRFVQALEQLADLSCGRLLQQNGHWMIIPKHTSVGTFIVNKEDVISWSADVQSDILDMIAQLIGYLKDAILALDAANRLIARIQNKIDNLSILEKLPVDPTPSIQQPSQERWQPMGEISFSFGWTGAYPLGRMSEQLVVETFPSIFDTWKYYALESKEPDTKFFWKVETTHERDSMGNTAARYRGLQDITMAKILYPFTPPSNAGLYRAKGKLTNLDCLHWGGDEDFFYSMMPTTRVRATTASGGTVDPFNSIQHYWEFSEKLGWGQMPQRSNENKRFYEAKMQVEYLPISTTPWKFTVNIEKTYRVIEGLNYMIPIDGGSVLNKNGTAVAEFDRAARVIKLQDGTIVSHVNCRADWPQKLPGVVDQLTGIITYAPIVKGEPYSCTAPVATPGGTTVTIVGNIRENGYVLKTQAGRFYGTVDRVTGAIQDFTGNTIGTYSTDINFGRVVFNPQPTRLWTTNIGYVFAASNALRMETVGIVQTPTRYSIADLQLQDQYGPLYDTGGTISFGNSVAYPTLTPDSNYSSLMSTLLANELAQARIDAAIAAAKIVCLKKELTYYGVNYSGIEAACAKWKIYFDAIELRDFPRVVIPPAVPPIPPTDDVINSYEVAAVAATGTAMVAVNASKPRERVVSVNYLYGNILPLPGQALTVKAVDGTTMEEEGGIIESVSFDSKTITISAKKGYPA